jgi:hypothetical protein
MLIDCFVFSCYYEVLQDPISKPLCYNGRKQVTFSYLKKLTYLLINLIKMR